MSMPLSTSWYALSSKQDFPTFVVDGSALSLAPRIDEMPRADILGLAERNLANLVAAVGATPRLARTYPELAQVRSLSDLAHVPPFTAADLAADGPPECDARLFDGADIGLVLGSGGTGGREKFLYHSWTYNEQISFLGARGIRTALGESRPKRLLNCSNFGHLYGSGLFIHDVCKHLPARVFPVGGHATSERLVELVDRHAIDTIVATPRALAAFFRAAEPGAIRSLRNALYQAGAMLDEDAAIIRAHGVRLRAASYATTETGPIGYQCEHCAPNEYHIHEDAFCVEIVDPGTLDSCPAGALGDVVVTSFSDTGTALVRYRPGDRGRLSEGRCPCGSATVRLALEGRSDWGIDVDGTLISEALLLAVLEPAGISAAEQFQLAIEWSGTTFSAVLRIDARNAPGVDPGRVRELVMSRDNLRRRFSPPRCTGLEVVACDAGCFHATHAGKHPPLYQTNR